jgi:hypothetical protein
MAENKYPRNVQPEMTFRFLPDGSREITHPSGLKVIETAKQRQDRRVEIVARIAEDTNQLKAIDAITAVVQEK